jgi:hypothetical protein
MTTLAGAAYMAFLAWAGAVTVLAARIPPYGSRPGEPRIRGPL